MSMMKEANGSVDNNFDDLPSEILIIILKFLNTKDATRTSVLSRKWRHLFTYQTNLTFIGSSKEKDDLYTDKFLDSIDQALGLKRAPYIEGFKICTVLNANQANDVSRWVEFALRKGVKTLELDVNINYTSSNSEVSSEDLPTAYTLSRSILMSAPYDSGFKLLTSLCLKHVAISENLIESILSKCDVLERLIIAWLVIDEEELRVASKSLKFLKIEGYMWNQTMEANLKVIEIDAVNLISLEYSANARVEYVSVPSLVEASFDGLEGLYSESLHFKPMDSSIYNQLSKLCLRLYLSKDTRLPNAPTFNNVRCLELIADVDDHNFYMFSYITSFLKLFPSLRKLQLQINWCCSCTWKEHCDSDNENEMMESDSEPEVDMLFNSDDTKGETYSVEDVRQDLEADGDQEETTSTLGHLRCLEWREAFRRHFRHELLLALSIVKSSKMLEKFVCDPRLPSNTYNDEDEEEIARENAKALSLVMPKHVD